MLGGEKLSNVVYDIKSNEWVKRDLVGFRQAFGITANDWRKYMDRSKYACDGGLVCFVPRASMLTCSSIRIGNPLTHDWKALPCLPPLPFENWKMIMVQLVTEEDTKCYKVILVVGDDRKRNCAAQCCDSKTGAWSWMESGLVYGNAGCSLRYNQLDSDPRVFDCKTKTMYKLVDRDILQAPDTMFKIVDRSYSRNPRPYLPGFDGVIATRWVMVKDRLFVLHDCSSNRQDPKGYKISEYAWQSNTSNLRIIKSSAPEYFPVTYTAFFLASGGFTFLLVDNGGSNQWQRQFIRLDDSSANDWHVLPDMGDGIRYRLYD